MNRSFNKYTILSEIKKRQFNNQRLLQLVLNQIESEYHVDIVQCSLHQNILTISVSKQLVATKLRYNLTQLTKKLQNIPEFHSLKKIKLQISLLPSAEKIVYVEPPFEPVYSNKSSELINSLSKTIGDPELSKSLKRLAKHIHAK